MMAFTAVAFQGTAGFGQFTDAGAVAPGIWRPMPAAPPV